MIIGITGKARHGKDTVGRMLGELLPNHRHFAFAGAVKDIVHGAFVAPKDHNEAKETTQRFVTTTWCLFEALSDYEEVFRKRYGVSLTLLILSLKATIRETHKNVEDNQTGVLSFDSSWRKLYQIVGTEWGRQKIDNNIWVNFLPTDNVIVTDVRAYGDSKERDVEAQAIKEAGGFLLKVVDPRKGDTVRSHASEAGVDSKYIDTTIYNNSSIEDLRIKVKHLVEGRILCHNK